MLIKCEECGKDISDRAKVCLHCGAPANGLNKAIKESSVRMARTLKMILKRMLRMLVPIVVIGIVLLFASLITHLYDSRFMSLHAANACLAISNCLVGGLLFLFTVKWAWGNRAFKVIGWIVFAFLSISLVLHIAPSVNVGAWKAIMFMAIFSFLPLIAIFNWLRSIPPSRTIEPSTNEHGIEAPLIHETAKSEEVQPVESVGSNEQSGCSSGDDKGDDKKCLGLVLSILAVMIGVIIVFAALQGASDKKLMDGVSMNGDVTVGEGCCSKAGCEKEILQDLDDSVISDLCDYWRTLSPRDKSAISLKERKSFSGQRINETAFLFLDFMPHLDDKNTAYFKKTVEFCCKRINGKCMEKGEVRRVYKNGAGLLLSYDEDYRIIKVVLPRSIVISQDCFYEPSKRTEEQWQEMRRMMKGTKRF